MKDGVVQQVDTPQHLYEEPGNLFVAGFMGSPQMNFLDATVSVSGDVASLVVAGRSIPLPPAKSKTPHPKNNPSGCHVMWHNGAYISNMNKTMNNK